MGILGWILGLFRKTVTGGMAPSELEAYFTNELKVDIMTSTLLMNTPTVPVFFVNSAALETAKPYLKRWAKCSVTKTVIKVGGYYYVFSDREGLKIGG